MSTVDEAATYADRLVGAECRGNGDKENAMRRVEARYGIPFWTLWGLAYRKPKQIAADQYLRLRHAYLDMTEGQIRRLQHELAVERARGNAAAFEDIADEAEALDQKLRAARQGPAGGRKG